MSDSSIVWLSVEVATAAAPIAPLAPVLFSTITLAPRRSPSGLLIRRAITSEVPPGGKGTMIFSGWSGHAAQAGRPRVAAAMAALDWRKWRRWVMVVSRVVALQLIAGSGTGAPKLVSRKSKSQ